MFSDYWNMNHQFEKAIADMFNIFVPLYMAWWLMYFTMRVCVCVCLHSTAKSLNAFKNMQQMLYMGNPFFRVFKTPFIF